jgi:peroxiredoxin
MTPKRNIFAVAAVLLLSLLLFLSGCSQEKTANQAVATVNSPAPDFSLTDTTGKQWQLSSLKGKVVFINFWATWCPPCLEELPSMQALQQGMANAPFQMITILNNDRPELAHAFANRYGYTFPILIDPDSKISNLYGLTGVPETFIIGPDGILKEKFIGPRNWNSQGAWDMLKQYMPQ